MSSIVRAIALYTLALLLLCGAPGVRGQSCRASETTETPTFICQHGVAIRLTSSCTAEIVETLVYPHTTASSGLRRTFSTLQGAPTALSVLRDGEEVSVELGDGPDRDEAEVDLPSVDKETSVTYVLTYTVVNLLQRLDERCNGNFPEPVDGDNILFWMLGSSREVVDRLDVTVESERAGELRWAVGTEGELGPEGSLELSRTDVREFEGYAVLSGGESCPVQFDCRTGLETWQIVLIAIGSGVLVIGVLLICAIRCGCFVRGVKVTGVEV